MLARLFAQGADQAPGPGPTIGAVVNSYLEWQSARVAAGQLTVRAAKKSEFYLRQFAASFGAVPAGQCRRGDVRRFLVSHPEYASPHTQADAAAQVVACFRWAAEDGLIDTCPYARPRDLPAAGPRSPITRDEVRLILCNAREDGYRLTCVRFRLSLWFLWESGCRTSELYALGWEHYDDGRGVFELAGKTTRRTGRKRLVVLTRRAWRLIRWLRRKDPRPAGAVFLNGRGRPWTKDSFGSLFRKHADRAGVRREVSAYCLRHGFTVEALEAGVGERQLADVLGHTTTRYVGWYGRALKSKVDYLRDAAEKRR